MIIVIKNKPNGDHIEITITIPRKLVNYLKTALTQLSVGIPMLLVLTSLQVNRPISPPPSPTPSLQAIAQSQS